MIETRPLQRECQFFSGFDLSGQVQQDSGSAHIDGSALLPQCAVTVLGTVVHRYGKWISALSPTVYGLLLASNGRYGFGHETILATSCKHRMKCGRQIGERSDYRPLPPEDV